LALADHQKWEYDQGDQIEGADECIDGEQDKVEDPFGEKKPGDQVIIE
jgi:hypothetical protein